MAIFIYHEEWDGSGEGIRANLKLYEFQQQAHQDLIKLRDNDQVIRAKMIVGTIIAEFEDSDSNESDVLVRYNTNTDGHDV